MKYKLIKTYPGSPKLGTILEMDKGTREFPNTTWLKIEEGLEINVKHYSEFWEPVVEKDYEIISIKCKVPNFGSYILNKISNGKFANEYKQINLDLEFYDIHSVKRLSDGEVFTVGDKVKEGYITKIIIKKDTIYLEV